MDDYTYEEHKYLTETYTAKFTSFYTSWNFIKITDISVVVLTLVFAKLKFGAKLFINIIIYCQVTLYMVK